MPLRRNRNKNQGAAIILALFIVAITAIIATGLIVNTQNQISSLLQRQASTQNSWDLTYVPIWVRNQMGQVHDTFSKEKTPPTWPQILPPVTLADGAVVSASIVPANARFNINNLGQAISAYFQIFQNLLQVVQPDLSADDAKKITQNVQNWLLPSTAGDSQYKNYYQAHQLMINVSELRLVAGMTPDLYQRVAPYLIALPNTNVPIDINSAEANLIAALLNKNKTAADSVVAYRRNQGLFTNTAAFFGLPEVGAGPQNQQLANLVTVAMPQYLLVQGSVEHNKVAIQQLWILQFNPERKTISTVILGKSL